MSAISKDIIINKHISETLHHTENRKNEKNFFFISKVGLKVEMCGRESEDFAAKFATKLTNLQTM